MKSRKGRKMQKGLSNIGNWLLRYVVKNTSRKWKRVKPLE